MILFAWYYHLFVLLSQRNATIVLHPEAHDEN